MRSNIEKRLHRVKIELEKKDVVCIYGTLCDTAENSERCNIFYSKCVKFTEFYNNLPSI